MLVGHSFGGLLAEKLLGEGLAAAAVAIDPAQIKGVLPLPWHSCGPASRRSATRPTAQGRLPDQKEFRFGFGNALTQEESDELYEAWTIPSPARPLFQAAAANFSLHSPAAVETGNQDRGRCS